MALNRIWRVLPILRWLPSYRREDARGDVVAGLTVGVMLIPQGMAYAMLAGIPPIYGLYASLVPLLVYPMIGSSRHLVTGPVAIDMLIVAAGIGGLAAKGSTAYVHYAVLAAFMVAALHLAMGALRLGFLANLLSRPVITGFAGAAALIIVASQVGSFLGIELGTTQYVHLILVEALTRIDSVHWISLAIAAGSVAGIVGLRSWKPTFPAELAVIGAGTLAVWAFGLEAAGVATVGELPRGLPVPAAPAFALDDVRALLPTAITLALVQFMGVVSVGRIYASRYRYGIDPNRELLALGAANLAGGLFQCLPVSGSFSRTTVDRKSVV